MSFDPEIPLLGIYPREIKMDTHTKTCTSVFIHDSHKSGSPKYLSVGEWINKLWYSHIMGYYSPVKRNEVLITHSSISESQKH